MRGEDLSRLRMVTAEGESRGFGEEEFPLALGGATSAIELVGTPLAAHLGVDGDEVFIQPAAGGAPVACNGALLSTSRWLRDGDLIRIGEHRLRCAVDREGLILRVVERRAPAAVETPRLVPPPRAAAGSPAGDLGRRIRPVAYTPPPATAVRRLPAWVPWRSLSLLALFAVLVLPAWFLFTARSVAVEIEPEADEVELSGHWPRPRVLASYLLRPGTYRVEARREGYRALDAEFEVGPESRQVVRFTLVELPGRLDIRTVPPSGAAVWIDENRVGAEPLAGLEVEKGVRQVRIAAPGYVEHLETVEVEGRSVTQELVAELVPLLAPIGFTSEPAGARILVDGDEIGTTPSTHSILAGDHRLELRLRGYKTARRRFTVEPDTPRDLPVVTLALADGGLAVASEPTGAAVAVDGVFRGTTPLDLDLGAGRDHQVVITLAGYLPQTHSVALDPEESRELAVVLEPSLGEVEFVTRPAGAELWIDGELAGSANQVVELVAVPHRIEIRLAGFLPQSRTVVPRPGFRQTVEVTLETAEEAAAKGIEPVIRTAQGQEMRLIDGATIQLGASRREPGRRANETQRQVEITRRFYLATHEVSNGQYREFDPEHRSGRAGHVALERDDHPVVRVSWDDAVRYSNWLSARDSLPVFYRRSGETWVPTRPLNHGYRLPLESEWALAARYPDGRTALKYPWGDSLPVPEGAGNYADAAAAPLLSSTLSGYRDGFAATAPVGSFRPNALGLFDLGGNVAEWVHDFYSLYAGASGVERDPMGPDEGEFHVIRGASWMHDSVTELRLSYRDYGVEPRPDLGFRIARFLLPAPPMESNP